MQMHMLVVIAWLWQRLWKQHNFVSRIQLGHVYHPQAFTSLAAAYEHVHAILDMLEGVCCITSAVRVSP